MCSQSYLGAVVHAGAEVVGDVERDDLAPGPRLEVVQLASGDVAAMYRHVAVAVGPTLFMPETHRVSDLVRYRAVLRHTHTHTHTHTHPATVKPPLNRGVTFSPEVGSTTSPLPSRLAAWRSG